MTHGDPARGGRHGDEGLKIGRARPAADLRLPRSQRGKPFFLWYAPMLPHQPHNPPERLLAKYRDKTDSLHRRQVLGDVRVVGRDVRRTARPSRQARPGRKHARRLRHRQRLDSRPCRGEHSPRAASARPTKAASARRSCSAGPASCSPGATRRRSSARSTSRRRFSRPAACRRPRKCTGSTCSIVADGKPAQRDAVFGEIYEHDVVRHRPPGAGLALPLVHCRRLEADSNPPMARRASYTTWRRIQANEARSSHTGTSTAPGVNCCESGRTGHPRLYSRGHSPAETARAPENAALARPFPAPEQ